MRRILTIAAFVAGAAMAGCAGGDITYRPAPQILPQHIKKLALRQIQNQSQQFGLEDRFYLRLQDEFLRDGRYPIVPEADAEGVVVTTIKRYTLTPIQYDASLVPTVYKLQVFVDLQFIDRTANVILWQEPNFEGNQTYSAATLPGGMTEEQARQALWDAFSRDIVKRTLEGFGSVTGSSIRKLGEQPPVPQAPPPTSLQSPSPAIPAPPQPGQ